MKFNPFAREVNSMSQEIEAQEHQQLREFASNREGMDEQVLIEQQKERAELTKWQQNLDPEIERFANWLRRMYEDKDKHGSPCWKKIQNVNEHGQLIDSEPMIAEEGIMEIVALMNPSANKNLMMSQYDKEVILATLKKLSDTLTLLLISRRKKWRIELADMTPIINMFQSVIEPTFWRAWGGNEKKYLGTIRKEAMISTEKQEPMKKKSFLFG